MTFFVSKNYNEIIHWKDLKYKPDDNFDTKMVYIPFRISDANLNDF